MDIASTIDTFARLSDRDKLSFLLRLAHELTIAARDTYAFQNNGVDAPERLRAINEIQHRVLASCLALNTDDTRRYPDDILFRMVLEHPEDAKLQALAEQCVRRLGIQRAPAA